MKNVLLILGSGILMAAGNLPADTTTLSGFTDTYLVMNRDSTPETQPLLIVEGYDCSACIDQRVLLNFNLGSFASDALIRKAELRLYSPSQPRPGAAYVRVYRMTRAWNGAQANWNNASQSVKWSNAGGDFESSPLASLRYTDQVNVWHTYDITTIIKGFVANPGSNLGIMLMMDPVMKTVAYVSSDASQSELRPKLFIDYTAGSAAVGSRNAVKPVPSDFNVVDSRLEFSFSGDARHSVQIGSLDGSIFFSGTVSGPDPVISLHGISPGTYVLRAAGTGEKLQRVFSITGR